jgi:anti-sigma-K factor RskA
MNCDELQDFYELYALGVAEEPERSEIRAHLNRNCEVCMGGVKRSIEMASLLGGTSPEAAPPARLRRRILASVGFEQNKFGWAPFWAAAAVLGLVAAVYFSGRERQFAEDALRLQEQLRTQTAELAHLNEVVSMISGPDTVVTSFGEKQPAKGKVYANPRGILLMASNLSPAPEGKMYEMWVIPKGAKPQAAGMFQSSADGTAIHMIRRPVAAGDTVAVTLEIAAGVDAPTSAILIVAPITGL